jgi:hypothetical protein
VTARRLLTVTIIVIAASPFAGTSAAKTRGPIFSLAVGYNGLPPSADAGLTPLRYADDDAVAFHEYARTFARRSFLLTMLDPDTQARHPGLASEARAPSLADLKRTVLEIQGGLDAAAAAGGEPIVLVFYSGHGARAPGDQSALTFVDGLLTKDALYDEVLAPLQARFLHLFIDACNAEAVVRPRDAQAQVVEVSPADLGAAFQKATLARFPRVGAVVASTAGAQAHEWDVYQAGIFTHELMSALRGGADVDGNRRIEYSELAAFLSAANREVSDARARPRTVVYPPALDRRAVIVDMEDVRDSGFLEGRADALGAFFVEDARGRRLLDLRAEASFRVSLAVPAGVTLYVRNHRGQATLRLDAGERFALERVRLAENDTRARGALESALRRGLFATTFGPGYYRGFVDSASDLVAVEVREPDALVIKPSLDGPLGEPARNRGPAWISFGAATALAAAAGIFGGLAWDARHDFDNTYLERQSLEAEARYNRNLTLSLTALAAAVVGAGIGLYLYTRDR